MHKRLLVVGAGGFSRALADAIRATDLYELIGFLDDQWPALTTTSEGPVLGNLSALETFRYSAEAVAIAMGDNAHRLKFFKQAIAAGFEVPAIVHPRAYVASSATLAPGVMVMAGAVVGSNSSLANGVLINSGAVLDHDCKVDFFAHVGVCASMGGGANLGPAAYLRQMCAIAAGATLMAEQCRAGQG